MCKELKVKVRNKIHKIKLEERSDNWKEKEDAIGMYTSSDKLIEIYKKLGRKKKAIVLLHELIHSIIHLTRKRYLTDRQEESIAYAVSENLADFLQKNPELLDQIIDGVKTRSKKVRYKNIKNKNT
jgi:hypothetical protein